MFRPAFAKIKVFCLQKKAIPSIVFAIISVCIASAYLDYRENEISLVAEPVPVIVAGRDLKRGERITEGDVRETTIPRRYAEPNHIEDAKNIEGMTLIVDAPEGSQIQVSHIAEVGDGVGMAALVPGGMRAISVKLDSSTYESGTIATGDMVDVFATIDVAEVPGVKTATMAIAEGVRVLAVEGEYMRTPLVKRSAASRGFSAMPGPESVFGKLPGITLLATPKTAQDIVFAKRYGDVSVALRGRNEADVHTVLEPTTALSVAGGHAGFIPAKREFREYRGRFR